MPYIPRTDQLEKGSNIRRLSREQKYVLHMYNALSYTSGHILYCVDGTNMVAEQHSAQVVYRYISSRSLCVSSSEFVVLISTFFSWVS